MAWKLIETKILWKSWRKQIRTLLKVTFFFGFFNQYADLYWIFVRKVSCHAIQTNFCSKVDSNCYHWKLWRYFEIRCKQFPFEHITSNVEQKRCSFRKLFFAIPKNTETKVISNIQSVSSQKDTKMPNGNDFRTSIISNILQCHSHKDWKTLLLFISQ